MSSITMIKKPWGYEELWAKTDKYVGKLLVIEPNKRLSRQYHKSKDETIYVVRGELILEIGSGENINRSVLLVGASYHVAPGTIHRFIASDFGCTLMEVSTPELDDVVRLEDDYKRCNQ